MTASSMESRLEPKVLYRRLDSLFGALDPNRSEPAILESFVGDCFRELKDGLGLSACLLYSEHRDGFELMARAGDDAFPVLDLVEAGLPPLALIFKHRVYIFAGTPEAEAPHGHGLLPPGPSAAIVVGRRPNRHVLLFLLAAGWAMDDLDFALNTLRAALGSRLMEVRVRGSFKEAAEIQQSLLVEEPPAFPGYEIAFRSLPTEEVSGDFYDFLNLSPDILGLAIGDASGHGLPAALLVRDIVTGLRMGLERDLKIAHVFSKLNRVIHRSSLSSRFVSVFYAEMESDGNLIYVNAGHQPPLLFTDAGVAELSVGGTVIGPLPEVLFRRGFATIPPGGTLVLATDGIIERRDRSSEFFGSEGIAAVVRQHRRSSAEEILDRIFTAAYDHGDGRPWEDDATLVVVRRVAEADAPLSSRR